MTNASCFTTLVSHKVAKRVSGEHVFANVAVTWLAWVGLGSYASAKLDSLAIAAAWSARSRNESSRVVGAKFMVLVFGLTESLSTNSTDCELLGFAF